LVVGADRAARLGSHESIVHLVRCDATELPFKAGTFNLVTAAMVFEHLERPSETMKEIARACRPGAHLVVFTPNRFNYAMLVAASTPHRFHVLYKRLTHYLSRGEWKSFEDDVFPTWYRANSVRRLRRLAEEAGFSEKRLQRLSLAHSFGFVRPLYACSLLFERVIDRPVLEILKADILAIFVRGPV
jgi:ubiquinone/menaquinone biosynthesis C-methylase UbiE